MQNNANSRPTTRLLPIPAFVCLLAAFVVSLELISNSLSLQSVTAPHEISPRMNYPENDVPTLLVLQRKQQMSVINNSTEAIMTTETTTAVTGINKIKQQPQPQEDESSRRAIFIISMGEKAAKTNLVERFVYSARNAGEYSGWIVLLTDAPTERYHNILNWTYLSLSSQHEQKFIIMNPLSEHYNTKFKHKDMVFKRFKTFVLHYIKMDSRLQNVKLVYYLDVDIVFANPLSHFFDGLERTYRIGDTVDVDPNSQQQLQRPSLVSGKLNRYHAGSTIWMFKGNAEVVQVQGGQMILDVSKSSGCLERWRYEIDKSAKNRKDQFPLMEIWKEQQDAIRKDKATNLECEIVRMEQGDYISFPNKTQVDLRVGEILSGTHTRTPYTTLVHIKNTASAANEVNETFHQVFVRDILRIPADQEDTLDITGLMRMKATKGDMKRAGA
jgi:hypothetical protein